MRYKLRRVLPAIALLVLPGILCPIVSAQSAVGQIRGTVTDQEGAVIQNAEVTVTNKATREVRKISTGDDGVYAVENLASGEYEVRVQAKGFSTQILNVRVQVTVTSTVDAQLRVGAADEIVEITAEAPVIDKTNYKIDGVITRERIENLPLNGRSFLSLAMLEPGVAVEFTSDPGPSPQNFFRVSIAGAASQLTRISVDGATANDRITGGTSQNYSQESVEEFQITSFNFDLSTGNTSAGAVNIVSRTGGNEFHGSGFFFFRDHNFAGFPGLRRPCDGLPGSHPQCGDPAVRSRLEDPFFARRQSGLNASGPIMKDKLFWFTNFEYTNQVGARTIAHTDPIFHGYNHIGAPNFKGKLFNARFDYKATAKHSGFLRLSFDLNRNLSATGSLESTWNSTRNHSDQFLGGITSVFTQNLVNDLRFSYSFQSSRLRSPDESECTNPFFCVNLGGTRISVPGGITVGNDTNTPQNRVLRTYQLTDNVNWLKGSHRVRFGGNWEHFYGQGSWGLLSTGLMSLYSPAQVQLQSPLLYAQLPATLKSTTAGTPTFEDILKLPVSSAVAIGVGDGGQPPAYNRDIASRIDSYRLYFQDSWQIRPNFTFNFGLAWSFEDNIVSHDLDKPPYLKPVLGDLRPTRQDYNNFQPAIGMAWSLGKQKDTVIRA
ncbi:MAG TPA: carboxypeptidase regulatory-like domain-containing protein, partial [Blastocatellia bacterium]|nr:carboxypeptidase regulatory-like domain-containing protein [Blastocatellia bacterium]